MPAPTAGDPCTATTDCSGAPCGVTGLATAGNQCDDAVCVAIGGDEGECSGNPGPFDQICSINTWSACLANSDCPDFPTESCIPKLRECYLDNGTIGGSIAAQGAPDLPVNDDSSPTLAAVFCMGTSSASAVNSVVGFPGAGRRLVTGLRARLP